MMNKTLLIITTAGRLHWLVEAIKSLKDPIDLLVVDDATSAEIGIENFCKEKEIPCITKSEPKGLTDTWNIGYQYFKKQGYTYCILSNDDVRFAEGFSRGLIKGLNTKFHLVGPVSNAPGNGGHQWVRKLMKKQMDFGDQNEVQKALIRRYQKEPFMPCNFANGFCFSFSTAITRFEFSSGMLFNPKHINIGNEHELAKRVRTRGGKIATCRISYVYHKKQGTYKELGWKVISGHRERLWK